MEPPYPYGGSTCKGGRRKRMPKQTKSRALYILKYLWLYTDDEHPASISDLTDYLAKNGMEAHRTTVSADIAELGNIGIDIIATRKTQMWYHIGNRFFEQPELKLLTDAVSAAKFISEKKSTELIGKLSALASENQQKQLLRHLFVAGQPKTKNEKVYYIVDAIHQAINEGRKLSFQYFGYLPDKTKELKHSGYVYAVSPYSLAWNGDNYYLIGFSEKHGVISNFRVDRITNLNLMAEKAVPLPEGFSVSEYCAKLFLMLGGMVLPFFQGMLFYGEAFTLAKGICLAFIIAALLCTLKKGERKKGTVFYVGIFVLNGMSGVISKIFTTGTLPKASAAGYSIWSATATIFLSTIAWLVLSRREKHMALADRAEREKIEKKVRWQSYGIGVLSGAINKVANFLLVLALVHVDASVQYPMVTGGTMIVSTALSFFGDKKPNKGEILGVLLAFLGMLALFLIPA